MIIVHQMDRIFNSVCRWLIHFVLGHSFSPFPLNMKLVLLYILVLSILPTWWDMVRHGETHSIMMYGIIFWGSSPHWGNIFKLQKRIIRTMMNINNRVSCRELFKKLNILPLQSQYILSLVLFVVKNINEFKHNFDVHSINTWQSWFISTNINTFQISYGCLLLRDKDLQSLTSTY